MRLLGVFGKVLALLLLGGAEAAFAAPNPLAGLSGVTTAPDATVPADALSKAAIIERLAQVEQELKAISPSPELIHGESGATRDALAAIARLLQQQLELVDQSDSIQAAVAQESSPASLLLLFRLHEQLHAQQRRQEALREGVNAARNALDDARKRFQQSEKQRRQLQDNPQESTAVPLAQRQLESRRMEEEQRLRSLELHLALQSAAANAVGPLQDRLQAVEIALSKAPSSLPPVLTELARREGDARRSQDTLRRELATADIELKAQEKRYAATAEPDANLLEDVRLLANRRDLLQRRILLLDSQLERLADLRITWQRWDEVIRSRKHREEFSQWTQTAQEQQSRLEQDRVKRQGRALELRQRLDDSRSRLSAEGMPARQRLLLKNLTATLEALLTAQNEEIDGLDQEWRLRQYLIDDVRERRTLLDPVAQLRKLTAAMVDLWRFEITNVDDRPITVGSVAIALTLIIVGLMVSRRLSSLLGGAISRRLKLDPGAVAAIETLSFYLLLVSFSLLALRAVNFPLTAFTVLGGALAIGIGFGSQNVMNNFISGLILMLERPVRAGDVIEIEGNPGVIEKIGARSTQIRSTDGRHLIVPNSFFLESNVVNWTLSDDLFRGKVSVGVAYGSDTRLVDRLIQQVIAAEPGILKDRESIIIFEEFGDSALLFDLYFWVHARSPMELRRVQSRIRFALDDAFRSSDVVIAFPQQDVHFNAASPIPVRMVTD